jgi:hypothetical protein
MSGLLKTRFNIGFIVNPFYLYCISFSLAIIVYIWGWCGIFPKLSSELLFFFLITFAIFIYAGRQFRKSEFNIAFYPGFNLYLNDIIFLLIIFLGLVNVLFMGYLPVLDRSHNYREFGMPVIDPVFNTLSIFFSVFFFQSFIEKKKKRFLIYVLVIILIHILFYRRSSVIWIVTSSVFLLLLYKKRISLLAIIAALICLPVLSFCFGAYGNVRSKLSESFVMNGLGASEKFKNSNISHNHYMTYLYISSPLANLQENIDKADIKVKGADFKKFLFYCLIPESFTLRFEKQLGMSPPACYLITPELIAGSFLMIAFYTLGWTGMIIMFLYLSLFIFLSLAVIRKWKTFSSVTLSLLSATVSMLIFSNFLNRLDVILMLFVYPVLFHLVYNLKSKFPVYTKIRESNGPN